MTRTQKLARKLQSEGEKTLEFFRDIPEDGWQVQLYADGACWTVHEVLAHIVESEGSLLRLFRHIAGGGDGVAKGFDIDQYNAMAVAEMAAMPAADLIADFEVRRGKLIVFVRTLNNADLEKQGRHAFLGETSLYEMLRLQYLHVNLHVRDIRKVMEEE
jgi:hypothetical protein